MKRGWNKGWMTKQSTWKGKLLGETFSRVWHWHACSTHHSLKVLLIYLKSFHRHQNQYQNPRAVMEPPKNPQEPAFNRACDSCRMHKVRCLPNTPSFSFPDSKSCIRCLKTGKLASFGAQLHSSFPVDHLLLDMSELGSLVIRHTLRKRTSNSGAFHIEDVRVNLSWSLS